jgi:opacity protein-like surface antigen
MRKKKLICKLMVLWTMSFFCTTYVLASLDSKSQKAESSSSKNPKKEKATSESEKESESEFPSSSPRRLRQHGLGFGLGQTFLLGDYSDHGDDKITFDLLYSYAASYSFDLLLNAHLSEHERQREKMRTMGLSTSIKARLVEYDNFSPYVLGGLGFYAPRTYREAGDSLEWSKQKITFGLNFGGGVDLRLNDHYIVGLLGQMHWPFTIRQDEGSDVKGYYFKLLITGMYQF